MPLYPGGSLFIKNAISDNEQLRTHWSCFKLFITTVVQDSHLSYADFKWIAHSSVSLAVNRHLTAEVSVSFWFVHWKYCNTCRQTDDFCAVILGSFLPLLKNSSSVTTPLSPSSVSVAECKQTGCAVHCAHMRVRGETTCNHDNLHRRCSAMSGRRNEHRRRPFGEMSRVCVWTLNIIRGFTRGQVWYKQFVTRCDSYQCRWAKASRLI